MGGGRGGGGGGLGWALISQLLNVNLLLNHLLLPLGWALIRGGRGRLGTEHYFFEGGWGGGGVVYAALAANTLFLLAYNLS